MKPAMIGLGLFLGLALPTAILADEPAKPTVIDLWPGPPPGDSGPSIGEEKLTRKAGSETIQSITNVSKPSLSVYQPEKSRNSGVAIVVCPGGGYTNLAWDHEGDQVARWLNSLGVTAAVLKYRVPRRPGSPRDQPPPQALMDAQRALGIVRSKAGEWGVDPKKVGILGFSAGGHLSAWAATNWDRRTYETIDASDSAPCRPDFAVLVYPGGVVKRDTLELSPEIKITSETPPMFLAHADNDPVPSENSVAIYLALKKAKVPVEMHIYSLGGHGFGMRPGPLPSATWPKRCEEWLRASKILAEK